MLPKQYTFLIFAPVTCHHCHTSWARSIPLTFYIGNLFYCFISVRIRQAEGGRGVSKQNHRILWRNTLLFQFYILSCFFQTQKCQEGYFQVPHKYICSQCKNCSVGEHARAGCSGTLDTECQKCTEVNISLLSCVYTPVFPNLREFLLGEAYFFKGGNGKLPLSITKRNGVIPSLYWMIHWLLLSPTGVDPYMYSIILIWQGNRFHCIVAKEEQ